MGNNKVNAKKAVMIGCGFVGSASVFALMQSGLFTEIVLIDADRNKAEGEAMDISHGIHLLLQCGFMQEIMTMLQMRQS